MKNKGAIITSIYLNILWIIVCYAIALSSCDDPLLFTFITSGIHGASMWIISSLIFNLIKHNKTGPIDAAIITIPSLLGAFVGMLLENAPTVICYIAPVFFMLCTTLLFLYRINKAL